MPRKLFIYLIEDAQGNVKVGCTNDETRPFLSVLYKSEGELRRVLVIRTDVASHLSNVVKHHFKESKVKISDYKSSTEWFNLDFEILLEFINGGIIYFNQDQITHQRWMVRYIQDKRQGNRKITKLWF